MADLTRLETRITEAGKKAEEALVRLKQLKARKAQIEAQQKALESRKRRTEENQRKYEVGGLVKLAGLLDVDKGALLGALLMAADRLASEEWLAKAKQRGDALLAEREQSRKAKVTETRRADQEKTGLRNPEPTPKEGQA